MTDPTNPTPAGEPAGQPQPAPEPPMAPWNPQPDATLPLSAAAQPQVTVPLGAPTSPKRSNARAWAVGGLALVIALCCGGAVIGAVASDDADPAATASSPATSSPTSPPPTTAAPTSAAPTTAAPSTAAPEPTTPPPAPKPKVIKGRGDDVVRIAELTDLAVVKFTCKCSSNTVLRSDGDGLLVNEIGSYSGKRWINLEDGSLTTQFEVEASGSWTLTIGTVDQLATKALAGKAAGKGDDVLLLGGDAAAAKITHKRGDSNFAVHAYSLETGEGGLLVNEIGGYSGVRPLQAPALVQITADGNWTINPA
ncbi:hypothetical protein ACGFJ5_04630 [Micromonospora echinaurantiaca]|uniref:hypothetical protein n=1 Tax=Micromonospora echinaurantiaca TaxID=47857 RepID=UPI003716B381